MGKRKKWLKWGAIVLGILLVGLVIAYFYTNEDRPKGVEGPQAEALAQKMLKAINDEAWQQTGAAGWTFAGKRSLVWDRARQYAKVNWDANEAYVKINSKEGVVFKNGQKVNGEAADELIEEAWKIWVNDAFWLNPVSKAYDPGTSRSLVETEDGRQGLMVEYSSGGDTPGDAYLWFLNEDGLPESWKMWVSIIPVGGMEVSWEDWIVTETGVKIATTHHFAGSDLKITNVKTARDLITLAGEDIFEGIF